MTQTVYLGRQPILDLKKNTFAYEILYRTGGDSNEFPQTNGTVATSQVLYNLFYNLDFKDVVGTKMAFINFTRDNLLQELPTSIDPKQTVIEVLEDVAVDSKVVEACRSLRQKGYKIALDDFFIKKGVKELLELADIVKIDWLNTPQEEIDYVTRYLKDYPVALLAEKIEREEDFLRAVDRGYRYFQGYFFERPTIIKGEDVPPSKWTYLRLFALIQRPELEPKDLAKVVRHDPVLTFKLLKLINSPAFGLRQEVTSVEQAIVLLGEKEMRRWLSLVIMANLNSDMPTEVLITASTRGYFGELVAKRIGRDDLAPSVFLMGIMSLLNTMIGRPMREIFSKINVSPPIKDALTRRSGPLLPFLILMIAYERANEKGLKRCQEYFNLTLEDFTQCYLEAIKWANLISNFSAY